VKYHAPETVLVLQGDHDFRRNACLNRLKEGELDAWEREIVRYVADELTDDELLRAAVASADKPRLNLARAEKLIAMKSLLLGKRDAAIQHLRACLDIPYLCDHVNWTYAFLKRLEADERWP
jgi:hypothetical protein